MTAVAPPAGRVDAIDPEARGLLRGMMRIRRFEEKCAELYSATRIRGFLHLCIGEEAVAVGVITSLAEGDAVISTYREHGHALARGVPMTAIMAEMFGRATGCRGLLLRRLYHPSQTPGWRPPRGISQQDPGVLHTPYPGPTNRSIFLDIPRRMVIPGPRRYDHFPYGGDPRRATSADRHVRRTTRVDNANGRMRSDETKPISSGDEAGTRTA